MPDCHHISFKAMGSPCQLQLYPPKDGSIQEVVELAQHEISRFEQKYTRFKDTSVTSKINSLAGTGTQFEVDEETQSLLNYADVLYQQSGGLFDITSGVLRRAWNFKSNTLPTECQLSAIIPLIGWEKVYWEPPYILLPEAGMEIDFGGYVKEYAADVVANKCKDAGIESGLVNLGGDIRVIGPHPNKLPWKVGIQHPRRVDQAIATVDLPLGAIATSGDYERFMVIDGVRYSHLLNPKTGESIQPHFCAISILADQCLVAGSLSTIAMLKSNGEPDWLESIGLPYLAIDKQLNICGSVIAK